MKKILIFLLIIILLSIPVLPRIVLHCIKNFPTIDDLFFPKLGNLEVEILGSGLIALIVSFFLFTYEESLRKKQNKEKSNRFYNKIILPSIKNSFLRSPSTLNRSSELNHKAYFDNSSINNLHDAIERYLDAIYEYIDYNDDIALVKKLINFYEQVELAYIRGEELDSLLRKMAFIVHLLPDNSQSVIHLKGLRYAKFLPDELNVLLPMYQHKEDFYGRLFNNPENDLKKTYKESFIKLDKEMKKSIKELKKEIKFVGSLIN